MNVNQLNSDVLRAFGIDAQHVTEAYIQLRPGHLPTAIVESVLQPLEVTALGDIKCATQHYRMEPVSAPAPEPQPPALDIEGMCCTARNAIHIAVELAGDDAKDALMLRSARYNLAHGLSLSSAQQVALDAATRKAMHLLNQTYQGLISFEEACAKIDLPELPVFHIDPTSKVTNWEPTHPTKWTPRSFGWDEGREHV